MRVWFPFCLLVVSILTVIIGCAAVYQPSVSHYVFSVASDTVRTFLYNGIAVVTFLPVVSLVAAVLVRSIKYRTATLWTASLWLIYWLGILVLYAMTKGR